MSQPPAQRSPESGGVFARFSCLILEVRRSETSRVPFLNKGSDSDCRLRFIGVECRADTRHLRARARDLLHPEPAASWLFGCGCDPTGAEAPRFSDFCSSESTGQR